MRSRPAICEDAELLAELTGAGDVQMMFYAGRLSVVLATVHVPLAHVPAC